MDEVDLLAVDVGEEVRPPVEPIFLGAPVERRLPVLAQALQIREVGAVVPTGSRDLIGPAGAGQAVAEIVEHRLRNLDAKRPDVVAHTNETLLRRPRWWPGRRVRGWRWRRCRWRCLWGWRPTARRWLRSTPRAARIRTAVERLRCAERKTSSRFEEYQMSPMTPPAIAAHEDQDDRQDLPDELARPGLLKRPLRVLACVDRGHDRKNEAADTDDREYEEQPAERHEVILAHRLLIGTRVGSLRSRAARPARRVPPRRQGRHRHRRECRLGCAIRARARRGRRQGRDRGPARGSSRSAGRRTPRCARRRV